MLKLLCIGIDVKGDDTLKKIGAFLAAVTLALAPSADMTVSAQDKPVFSINAGYGAENDITEVELKIENNSGISAYSVRIDFDPRVLEFVEAEQGYAIESGTFYSNGEYSEDCVRLVWSDSRNRSGDGVLAVLRFKTANETAETKTALSIGHSTVSNDLSAAEFETENAELRISGDYTAGDVNMDGIVDVSDVVGLNMHLLEGITDELSFTVQASCEVSGDKKISSDDSVCLINHVSMITEVD